MFFSIISTMTDLKRKKKSNMELFFTYFRTVSWFQLVCLEKENGRVVYSFLEVEISALLIFLLYSIQALVRTCGCFYSWLAAAAKYSLGWCLTLLLSLC